MGDFGPFLVLFIEVLEEAEEVAQTNQSDYNFF